MSDDTEPQSQDVSAIIIRLKYAKPDTQKAIIGRLTTAQALDILQANQLSDEELLDAIVRQSDPLLQAHVSFTTPIPEVVQKPFVMPDQMNSDDSGQMVLIASKFNRLVRLKGKSNSWLGGCLQVSRQTIHQWRHGVSSPSPQHRGRLCEILNCTESDLFELKPKPLYIKKTKIYHPAGDSSQLQMGKASNRLVTHPYLTDVQMRVFLEAMTSVFGINTRGRLKIAPGKLALAPAILLALSEAPEKRIDVLERISNTISFTDEARKVYATSKDEHWMIQSSGAAETLEKAELMERNRINTNVSIWNITSAGIALRNKMLSLQKEKAVYTARETSFLLALRRRSCLEVIYDAGGSLSSKTIVKRVFPSIKRYLNAEAFDVLNDKTVRWKRHILAALGRLRDDGLLVAPPVRTRDGLWKLTPAGMTEGRQFKIQKMTGQKPS